MAVIVNGDGILTGISSLATDLTDITSGRGTITGVTTVGTLQLGAGVSMSSPRTQNAAIFTNNTEFLTIDDAGRVGVGTITPNSDAHPQNVGKINVGFITARSVAGDIDANTMVVAGVSTFVGTLNSPGGIILTGNMSVASDTAKIFFGASNDLSIYHNGSNSYIHETGTGALIVKSNLVSFRNAADTEQLATFTEDGNVVLYHDNTGRLNTDSTGITVTNRITGGGDANTYINVGPNDIIDLYTGGTNVTRMDASGRTLIGTTTQRNNAKLQVTTDQQVVASFEGTGVSDPQIYLGDNMASPTDNCIVIGYDKADNRGYLTVGGDGDNVFTITNGGAIGINNTAPVEKLGISGNMRFINPNDNTSRISALYSGSYNLGSSGGSAIAFHRVTDGIGGSDEIAFETHWQGNRHGEAARFNKYGNLAFPTNQGIDFSADGSAAGMTSELLHDYEEGTWTPIVQWSSGTGAAGGGNAGFYVKIGCLVCVYATVNWTSVSGATVSYARINGLPFVYRNLSHYRSTVLIGGQIVGVEGGSSYNIAIGTDANNDFLYITPVNGAQTSGGANYSHSPTIKSSGTISGLAVTYMTSA